MSWNEKGFGWLQPNEPIRNLPGQYSSITKVFIHFRDLIGMKKLEKDQEVQFLLYADERGSVRVDAKVTLGIYFFCMGLNKTKRKVY